MKAYRSYPTRGEGVSLGGADDNGFMETEVIADSLLVHEGVHEGELGGARISEEALHPFVDEGVEKQISAVHFSAVAYPSSRKGKSITSSVPRRRPAPRLWR